MTFTPISPVKNHFQTSSVHSKQPINARFSGKSEAKEPASLPQLRSDLLEIQLKQDKEDKPTVAYEDLVRHWPNIQDLMNHPYLPFDTAETVEARKKLLKTHHQYLQDTGRMETIEIDTPERQKFREEVINMLHSKVDAKQDRQAYLVVGPHGAGKSTIAGPLSKRLSEKCNKLSGLVVFACNAGRE